MTQNPYAQFGQPGQPAGGGVGGEFLEPLDSRTSVLAILSLIAGLICFIPGAGVLALVFGGAAVILISQSRGRLRGLGLAITGIVLGLLFSIVWVMIWMGVAATAQFFNQRLMTPVASVVTGLDTGDQTKARALFTPQANAAISDKQLDEFAAALKREWGPLRAAPKSVFEMFGDYIEVGPRMEALQGRSDTIPVPVRFDNGVTIIALQIEQTARVGRRGPRGPSDDIPVINIGFIAKDRTIFWVVPPEKAVVPAPAGEDESDSAPKDDSAPTPTNPPEAPPPEPPRPQ